MSGSVQRSFRRVARRWVAVLLSSHGNAEILAGARGRDRPHDFDFWIFLAAALIWRQSRPDVLCDLRVLDHADLERKIFGRCARTVDFLHQPRAENLRAV